MFFASHGECLLSCDIVVSAVLGGVGERGWGGVGLSDSCFPSALSQAVATLLRGSEGATQRSESQRYAWAKILPIRWSSQFVLSYPRCLSGVSGPLGVMHKKRWMGCCCHMGVIMRFPHCFLSFHPSSTESCCYAWSALARLPRLVSGSKPLL